MSTIEGPKRARRLTASLPVSLSEGAAHYVLDTENVSDTGICLRPEKLFPVGTELHLVFGRPPELPAITAQGTVRWYEVEKGVGVQFTSISVDNHQALLSFVKSQVRREQA